jgi:hypothetical protein
MDPYLQNISFSDRVSVLKGFAGRVHTGYYGRGKQVQTGSVSSAITSVGQAIALATNTNPTKIEGSEKLLPRLQQMLDGFQKADPATVKQLPVEADMPEFLVKRGLVPDACKLDHAIGDLTMIAFYYLLRIGKYTTKGARNNSKQTEEFKLGDITFFSKDTRGQLRCLPRDAPAELVLAAKGATTTMKLDNQKNGWKDVCVYQECNGDPIHCPVRALRRRCVHLQTHGATNRTILSAYYHAGQRFAITSDHVSMALKHAATALEYPLVKGIPIE